MVKYLKKLYDKLFKSQQDIEYQKKVEFYNRVNPKTTETRPNLKTIKPTNQTI
jgi:alpha-amylase/alpha-mannosidase (GH57 family)